MNFNCQASFRPVPQDEPSEGRMEIPLYGPDGSPLVFDTVGKVYTFDGNSMISGGVRPSAILSVWIDTNQLDGAANLFVSNGLQTLKLAALNQGYALLPTTKPAVITIYSDVAAGASFATVILFNYNVFASGAVVSAQAATRSNSVSQPPGSKYRVSGGTAGTFST